MNSAVAIIGAIPDQPSFVDAVVDTTRLISIVAANAISLDFLLEGSELGLVVATSDEGQCESERKETPHGEIYYRMSALSATEVQ